VGEGALVGGEEGEELERQEGGSVAEVLDHGLMGESAGGDPVEIGEPLLDALAAELRERSAGRHQPEAAAEVQARSSPRSGRPGGAPVKEERRSRAAGSRDKWLRS